MSINDSLYIKRPPFNENHWMITVKFLYYTSTDLLLIEFPSAVFFISVSFFDVFNTVVCYYISDHFYQVRACQNRRVESKRGLRTPFFYWHLLRSGKVGPWPSVYPVVLGVFYIGYTFFFFFSLNKIISEFPLVFR